MNLLDKFKERPSWRWLAWGLFVLLSTTALVAPLPAVDNWPVEISQGQIYFFAKTAHVWAYALMTILSGWLGVTVRFRWLLLFFLMAHAAATEWIQLNLSGRNGTVDDVLLDHLGIATGLIVSRKWWFRDRSRG